MIHPGTLPAVPLDQSFIGREYPPTEPYEVGREKIREFADAVGEDSPLHRDAQAAEAAEKVRDANGGGYGSWPACSQSLGLPQ